MAMSATKRDAPTPTPTPMPIFAPLERPLDAGLDVGSPCNGPPVVPVSDGPRDDTPGDGVAVGVNATPIFWASDVAYATGNFERSDASHATYSGSATANPLVIVVMFEIVDWSFTTSS
tara:strand:- start:1049 stop:1402 length:354 start_codon:yes stop_codon:yes gene_type:complete